MEHRTQPDTRLPGNRKLIALTVCLLAQMTLANGFGAETVKVGVLHSLTGTMAISESSLRDALLFTFDEINRSGGVAGRMIEPVVVDPASNWPLFAEDARHLLVEEKVAVVFGCWTSVSRKMVLPIFERFNGLLFYAVQYEGEELSTNLFYTGETVNQQALPAVDYLLAAGRKRFYLLGTDYIYPRTTNHVLRRYLLQRGIHDEDIMEIYTPFGHRDYHTVVAHIRRFARGGGGAVINTLNGDTNLPFFEEFARAGLTAKECPIVSLSISENELRILPAQYLAGQLGCWTYFMSLDTPENRTFVSDFMAWVKDPKVTGVDFRVTGIAPSGHVTCSPMNLSRIGVHLWKQAVEHAGSFDVNKVRAALTGQSFKGPAGTVIMQKNHHLVNNVYLGRVTPEGQFNVIRSFGRVPAEPFSDRFLK